MNDAERLAEIETEIDRLVQAARAAPVLVEGTRDRRALQELGVDGNIVLVNAGRSILSLADDLAREHGAVIILMDWDRTGGRLTRRLLETLERHGVTCDVRHRRVLASLTGREASTVEELPGVLQRLRDKVGVPKPDRHGPP